MADTISNIAQCFRSDRWVAVRDGKMSTIDKPGFFEQLPGWLGGENRREPGVNLSEISAHVMAVLEHDLHLNLADLETIESRLNQLEARTKTPPAALTESIDAVAGKIEELRLVERVNQEYGLETTYEELVEFVDESIEVGESAAQFERLFALDRLLHKHGKDWKWLERHLSQEDYSALAAGEELLTREADGRIRIGWGNSYLPFE